MKEKNQKRLMIAGLVLVSALLLFGISKVLYREPAAELPETDIQEAEMEVVVEDETLAEKSEDNADSKEPEKLVIETEPEVVGDGTEQALQKTPEKTENEKPEEPPALSEDADITNPESEPEYKEETESESVKEAEKTDTASEHGQKQDGEIYIDGFGWVTNNGGGGSGTTASDMYENGNKVGIME